MSKKMCSETKLSEPDIRAKHALVALMEKHKLNNTQMARLLEVEPWTVGAWINEQRVISDKYRTRIFELNSHSADYDIFLMPPLIKLHHRIYETTDERLDTISNIQAIFNKSIKNRYSKADSWREITPKELESLEALWSVYDDDSIIQLNTLVAGVLGKRRAINIKSDSEFIQEFKEKLEGSEYEIIENEDVLSISTYHDFDQNQQLNDCPAFIAEQYDFNSTFDRENGYQYSGDTERLVNELRDRFMDDARGELENFLDHTAFKINRDCCEWTRTDTYMVTFEIPKNDPDLKESLKKVLVRAGFSI